MHRGWSTLFLKGMMILAGGAILGLCGWLTMKAIQEVSTHQETPLFLLSLLAGVYAGSLTVIIGLRKAFAVVTLIEHDAYFSEAAFYALKSMKGCACLLLILLLAEMGALRLHANVTGDDPAGPIALGLLGALGTSLFIAVVDAVQKPLKQYVK